MVGNFNKSPVLSDDISGRGQDGGTAAEEKVNNVHSCLTYDYGLIKYLIKLKI